MQLSDAEKVATLLTRQSGENPFSDALLQFCQKLSDVLLQEKTLRSHGELVALGFWIRSSRLETLKHRYYSAEQLLRPRGIAFHITPGNVDVMFAYSWLLSLLTGNSNIVRLSSKGNEVQKLLVEIIKEILSQAQFKAIQNNNHFVTYNYDSGLTEYFSSFCDIRVIWGGDNTIQQIRQAEIPATAKEIVFADRFSFALIDAETVNHSENISALIAAFKKDVFIYGQQACSSPRLLVWLGEPASVVRAKTLFWSEFEKQCDELEPLSSSELVDKTVISQYLAIQGNPVDLSQAPALHRIELNHLTPQIQQLHCGNGLIYESSINTLEELSNITNKHFQTCSYFGVEADEIKQRVMNGELNDIYRYVPIGKALDFDTYWDGMDLLYEFSQVISI